MSKHFDRTGGYRPKVCKEHGLTNPCFACGVNAEVKEKREKQRLAEVAAINAISSRIWAEEFRKRHEKEMARYGSKCVHGHLFASVYCDVCSIKILDPDYDRDKYRAEILKATASVRRAPELRNPSTLKSGADLRGERVPAEGYQDANDLMQLVDLEIWLACTKYGDQMNEKLAYRVARNVAAKFAKEWAEDQTITVTNEDGEEQRIARFVRFDATAENEDGDDDEDTPSAAEREVETLRRDEGGGDELWESMKERVPELRALVGTWRGSQRAVGEALLNGGLTVRDVPGVPKSTAHRVRKVVLEAFRKLLQGKGL